MGPDEPVHEAELLLHRLGQHERVEVRLAHRAVDGVHGDRHRHPGLQQVVDGALCVGVEVDGVDRLVPVAEPVGADPECGRRLQRVHDVGVVGEGLGPVLPRVRGRVGGDVALRPVGRRALVVVALQRLAIVRPLVAEDGAIGVLLARVAHEAIPVVVAHLVTHVADQGPVGLAHLRAPALAFGIVALGDVDGDQPVGVARQHWRHGAVGVLLVGEKVEAEAVLGVLGRRGLGQVPADDRIEEVALGLFEAAPGLDGAGVGEIRDRMVMDAGAAERAATVLAHQPVAGQMLGIGARVVGDAVDRPRTPGRRRQHDPARGVEAERIAAIHALRGVEINLVAAVPARKPLHT